MSSESPAVVLYDASGHPLSVLDGVAIPANTPSILLQGETYEGKAKRLQVLADGQLRVVASPPKPPPGTTEFVLSQDEANLDVGPSPLYHDTDSAVVGDSVKLYLQIFVAGGEGDPSEKGSAVEVYWVEGAGPTMHLVERLFVTGASVPMILPDVHNARDGTAMVGNGSNTKLRLRRRRMSVSEAAIDASVRGYTET